MAKVFVAAVITLAALATGCSGSTPDEAAVISPTEESTGEPDRATVDPIEPTAVPAPTEAPADTGTAVPEPADPTTTAAEDPEGGEVIISPEAPLPSRWLCTVDVDDSEELNLRQDPTIEAPIVFGIPGGSCRMRALGEESDGWVKVVYETQNISVVGHVSTDFAAEDPARTLALAWFEHVVAEQDTSDLAEQEFVDEWIAFHPFPSAAYRAVPFDIGLPGDCHPMDFGVSGCPVHVLDSAGELITPMVIQTHLVAQPAGDAEPRVIGFDLCFGTEDCEVADFSLHNRVVVDYSLSLAGVEIGAEADGAVEALTAVFGQPTSDSGWVVGCPLDGQSDVNERFVVWGSLSASFRRGDFDQEGEYFHSWLYALDERRNAELGGPQPWEVRLPDGAALGMNISVAAVTTGATGATGADLFLNEVFQVQQLHSDAWSFWGQGVETDTRINQVGVPFIPICD